MTDTKARLVEAIDAATKSIPLAFRKDVRAGLERLSEAVIEEARARAREDRRDPDRDRQTGTGAVQS